MGRQAVPQDGPASVPRRGSPITPPTDTGELPSLLTSILVPKDPKSSKRIKPGLAWARV